MPDVDYSKRLKEQASHVSELSIAIHRLNDANAGLAKGFAEFSSTGNKAWTVISRFLSGTGLWRASNFIRALGNSLEVYYLNQTKAMEEQMKTVESNMALAESYAKIKENLKKIDKSDYYKMLKDSGEFTKDEALNFATEFYTDLEKKMEKGMVRQRKGLRQLFDPDMRGRIEDAGAMKELLSPFSKTKDFFWGRQRKHGKQERAKGREDKWWKRKSGLTKMIHKMKSKKVISNLGLFLRDSLVFLGKAMIWFFLIATGIAVVAFILKKAWPSMKKNLKESWKFWKKVGLGLFAIMLALFTMLKMAFKGDIVGVIRTFVLKLLPAVASTLGNLMLAVLTTVVSVLGALLEGIVKSIFAFIGGHWIGRLFGMDKPVAIGKLNALNQGTRSGVPQYAHGGLHSGGLAIVGEGGAELVSLPAGARIHSNADSKTMMGNTININVSGSMGTSDAELRRLADKLSQEINKRVNRTVASPSGYR